MTEKQQKYKCSFMRRAWLGWVEKKDLVAEEFSNLRLSDIGLSRRSKAERLTYLRCEIARIQDIQYPEHLAEAREVCVVALEQRVEDVLSGLA